jgi:glutathione synthase
MTARYLIVADPVATLNTEFDLGVCLSKELLARGIEVDYMDLLASDANQATEAYLSELPVQQVLAADGNRDPFWDLGPVRRAPVTDYQVILQRKDPPVDDLFRAYGNHFAQAPSNILQINRPPATHEFQEHTIHLRYPEYAAPTWVCESFEELVAAVRRQPTEAVAKPLGTYCGVGVNFLDPNESEERLREFWEEWKPAATVQPFL